jgi:hypothetical protein
MNMDLVLIYRSKTHNFECDFYRIKCFILQLQLDVFSSKIPSFPKEFFFLEMSLQRKESTLISPPTFTRGGKQWRPP